MLISENSLEATLGKIGEIDPEDRRIIIYTGVHPNEGTTGLMRPHHKKLENYGAIVVQHPSDSNVQAIWERHKKRCEVNGGYVFKPLPVEEKLIESDYERAFSLGSPTFFVRFHGGPKEVVILSPQYNRIQIFPGHNCETNEYGGIHKKLATFALDRHNIEYNDHPSLFRDLPNNSTLLEYCYSWGLDVEGLGQFEKLAIEEGMKPYELHEGEYASHNTSLIPHTLNKFDSNWQNKGNIASEYLCQRKIAPWDISKFHSSFAEPFFEMVGLIGENLPDTKNPTKYSLRNNGWK
ncbi:MAG: hypothetical protein JW727_05900 [Candidatus Aenigmarchaeota archaeon]|nr:hypothetical protein [Candidatus Aenigmarchaeota archaeon]